jgi:hypothetical protein
LKINEKKVGDMKRILNILDMILRIFRKGRSEKNGNKTAAEKEKTKKIRIPARKYRRRAYRNGHIRKERKFPGREFRGVEYGNFFDKSK